MKRSSDDKQYGGAKRQRGMADNSPTPAHGRVPAAPLITSSLAEFLAQRGRTARPVTQNLARGAGDQGSGPQGQAHQLEAHASRRGTTPSAALPPSGSTEGHGGPAPRFKEQAARLDTPTAASLAAVARDAQRGTRATDGLLPRSTSLTMHGARVSQDRLDSSGLGKRASAGGALAAMCTNTNTPATAPSPPRVPHLATITKRVETSSRSWEKTGGRAVLPTTQPAGQLGSLVDWAKARAAAHKETGGPPPMQGQALGVEAAQLRAGPLGLHIANQAQELVLTRGSNVLPANGQSPAQKETEELSSVGSAGAAAPREAEVGAQEALARRAEAACSKAVKGVSQQVERLLQCLLSQLHQVEQQLAGAGPQAVGQLVVGAVPQAVLHQVAAIRNSVEQQWSQLQVGLLALPHRVAVAINHVPEEPPPQDATDEATGKWPHHNAVPCEVPPVELHVASRQDVGAAKEELVQSPLRLPSSPLRMPSPSLTAVLEIAEPSQMDGIPNWQPFEAEQQDDVDAVNSDDPATRGLEINGDLPPASVGSGGRLARGL